jgi:hypothetical protein
MKVSRCIGFLAIIIVLLCCFSTALQAQTATSGTVLGTVVDPSGAMVGKAMVELVNIGTGSTIEAQTNTSGGYTFATVAPGIYNLTVSAPGFQTSTVSGVNIQVNTNSTVNFKLLLGQTTQVVSVTGSMAQVELQTTDSTVGDVIGTQALAQLPTRLRQAQELTFLQPGTTPTNSGDSGGSVAGALNDQTTFSYDGIDVSDNETNSIVDSDHGARPLLLISVEAVDEFRVGVSNNNSTFNRASGGQVTLIGKSGSNKYHGGVFYYGQNSIFNANTWDNKHVGLKKPHVDDNRFGGEVGGPIFRDKTFFFTEYEARRYPETFEETAIVPTATLASGILQFKDGTGTVIPYNLASSATISSKCGASGTAPCDARGIGISPTMAAMMKLESGPGYANDPGLSGTDGLNTTGFEGNAKTPLTDDFGTIRIDHNLNAKWHLNGSFSYSRDLAYDSTPLVLGILNPNDLENGTFLPNWTNAFIFGATGQLTPNLTENFEFGDVRNRNGALNPQLSSVAAELALPGTNDGSAGYVAISPNVFQAPITMSNTVRSQTNNDVTLQFVDNLTWVKHNHIIQAGASLERINLVHTHSGKVGGAVNSLNGTETADSSYLDIVAADRPMPCATSTSANCLPSGSSSTWDSLYASTLGMMNDDNTFIVRNAATQAQPIGTLVHMNALAYAPSFYAQDTWRVVPSVTLTYGLSYSWQTPYNFANQAESLLVNAANDQPISATTYLQQRVASAEAGDIFNPTLGFMPVAKTSLGSAYSTDYSNIAPRVALAWSPSHSDGVMGKVFGMQKTVLRGGFGIYYDRLNGELAVVDPGLTAGPSSTYSTGLQTCAASGTPGANCNASSSDPGLSDFRFGVDGAIPQPSYPSTLATPYIPGNNYPELVSDGIDVNYKNPRQYTTNFTIQRSVGLGAVVEAGWVGRFGRRTEMNAELNASPYMFADTGSSQTFAQAYDAVANALRAGTAVAVQPWFEDQLPGVGSAHGYTSTTAYLAAVQASNFENGDVANIFDTTTSSTPGLNYLRKNLGLQPYDETQVTDLSIATNGGFSNYNAALFTLRRAGKNLTLDLNYTFSKSLDTNDGVGNDSTNLGNPLDPGVDYGPSHFDRRNTFNAIFVYNLPHAYSILPAPVNAVVGGWHVSGIVTIISALPLYVTESSQTFGGGTRSSASSPAVPLVATSSIQSGVHNNVAGSGGIGTSGGTSGINLFANPQTVHSDFGYVQLSQNADGYGRPLRGLPYRNTDFSAGKVIPIHEIVKLNFAADAYNLFNNVTFNNPSLPYLGSSVSSFGVMTSTYVPENRQASSRWVMLSGRLEF